jgi:hypothetical protein
MSNKQFNRESNDQSSRSIGKVVVKKVIALSILGGLVTLATRLFRSRKQRD